MVYEPTPAEIAKRTAEIRAEHLGANGAAQPGRSPGKPREQPSPVPDLFPEDRFIRAALAEGRAVKTRARLNDIEVDPGAYQARIRGIVTAHCLSLQPIVDEGGELSPVVLFADRQHSRLILADGHHRRQCYIQARRADIPAYVVTVDDPAKEAVLYAAMCNQTRTLPREREDIKKAVFMVFALAECWQWSDMCIAQHCGVSVTTVQKYRGEYSAKSGVSLPEMTVARDGRKVPYKHSATSLGTPTRDGRFVKSVGGKQRTLASGGDRHRASKRLDAINGAIQEKRVTLAFTIFLETMKRRGFHFEPVAGVGMQMAFPALKAARGHGIIWSSATFETKTDLAAAYASVRLGRMLAGEPDSRLVVVCYPEDGPAKLMDLARRDGIEFMSPDELVQALKGEPATEPQ